MTKISTEIAGTPGAKDAERGQGPAPSPPSLCRGTTRSGEPCRMSVKKGDLYCCAHTPDPEIRNKVHQGRVRAGKKSRKVRDLKQQVLLPEDLPSSFESVKDVYRGLEITVRALLCGRVDPKRANGAVLAFSAMGKIKGDLDFETRVAELEKRIARDQ